MNDRIDLFSLDDEIWNMVRLIKNKTTLNGSNSTYLMILKDEELLAVSSQPFTMEQVKKQLKRDWF